MNITRWDAFPDIDNLFRQYSPLFAQTLQRNRAEDAQWTPIADISETEKEYLIKAELPEVRKEDVKVTFDNGAITIAGERRQEKEDKGQNEIRVERFYGFFSRTFSLPDNIDPKAIRAETKDGVLRVHIPKTEVSNTRPLKIEVK